MNRLISAQRSSEKLREKIKELTQRIHQLEDALSLLQSTVSNEVHPLLTDKHRVSAELAPDAADLENRAVTNALGSLTIRDREQTFFGQAAGSETLFMVRLYYYYRHGSCLSLLLITCLLRRIFLNSMLLLYHHRTHKNLKRTQLPPTPSLAYVIYFHS
jgi:hypothetical protein